MSHPNSSSPVGFQSANLFEWLFSNPFENESDFTTAQQRVPRGSNEEKLLIDEATDNSLSSSQLHKDALILAAGLQAIHGLNPNEVVALPPTPTCKKPEIAPLVLIQVPNCLPFATAFLGTIAAGLTATLVSPALTSHELAWVLQNARPKVIITATACLGAMKEAISKQDDKAAFENIPVYTVDVGGDKYPAAPTTTSQNDWRQLLASPTGHKLIKPTTFDPKSRTALILWSSGTSGKSKGVMLSHHALCFSLASLWHNADFYLGRPQRWLGYVPFYHIFGLLNVLLLAIPTRSTVYSMSAFKLDAMLAAIPKRQITYLHMAPPIAIMLAKSPLVEPYARRKDFASVAAAVTGGAPLGHAVVLQVYDRCGFRIRLGYGLTEAGSVTVQSGISAEEMRSQSDDTGGPHWGVEVKIVAEDSSVASSKAAKAGDAGEVLIRSPGLMLGYLPTGGYATQTAPDMSLSADALTPDGWFRTGDVGIINPAGSLRLIDRIKELIKVRAYQVAPAELEAILCSSPAVVDAGVVGIYDEDQATEWPRAYVVAAGDKTEKELTALAFQLRDVVEKQTAKYKWLKGGLVFVKAIPKSPSGKILRRIIKQSGVEGFEVSVYKPNPRAAKL
ncbi:uncharacterized protein GGS25DRAFT_504888 [Hypoxylon fragiforme]|uniref:uncharacterized protein n=1 Tax=Hypoxylon fragiforme TaxID=63214 RepID=UPI0020C5D89E|nr:uncharacterized protein GGS25DRAFT_504888 [Hypoxylon fragiforme]KAI2605382.1 hypothetical protein GGS25DRAFT_504888 [Hypoxylon fragiforme]